MKLPVTRTATLALILATPAFAQSPQAFVLTQSTLTYHMVHPVHTVDGISHAARGKGICSNGACNFLVAAPVKSFDSGDTNRDEHMLQVTRGAEFPIVTVRFTLPESAINSPTLDCDLEVSFAGNTAHYTHVAFQQTIQGHIHHITGTVPTTLTDFKIPAPSFLTVPIHNDIPVNVDTTWQPQ
jgi:hypothetical protein